MSVRDWKKQQAQRPQGTPEPAPAILGTAAMVTFEYLTATISDAEAATCETLNAYGASRWELVSVVRSMRPDYVTAFFKRIK